MVRIVNLNKNHQKDIGAIALLLILWLFFFWQLITPVDQDRIVIQPNGDFGGQFYNFSSYQAFRFAEDSKLPLWNPYNFSGSPFLDPQQANAYPIRWLSLLIFKNNWSYFSLEAEMMFHYLLASILMYIFARRVTNHPLGGLVAALTFTYGAALTDFPMQQTSILLSSVWLPGILLGIHEGTTPNRNWRWFIIAGTFMGLAILAGHPQISLYHGILALAYLGYRTYSQKLDSRRGLAGGAIFSITGAGLGAISLLTTYDFYRFATRTDDFNYASKSTGYFLHNIWQILWTVHDLAAYWYIGMLVFFLAGLALIFQREISRFWFAGGMVSLLVGFGSKTVVFRFFYVFIPGFSSFRNPERAILIWSFCAAMLAGLGAVSLIKHLEERHRSNLTKALAGLTGIAAIYFVIVYNSGERPYGLIDREMAGYVLLLTLIMAVTLPYIAQNRAMAGQMLLIGVVVFDVFSVSQGRPYNHIYGDPGEVLSQESAPPWVTDVGRLLENSPYARVDSGGKIGAFGTLYRLPDIQGTGTLKLKTTVQMGSLSPEKRWELFSVRYVVSEEELAADLATPLSESYRDYAGVPFRIYELNSPRPLGMMVYGVDVVFSDEQGLAVLAAPDYPIRERLVLHDYPPITLDPDQIPEESSVIVKSFEPERVKITANTDQNGILSISIPYHSGWFARENGEAVEILRANAGLMAIPLEAGNHEIELEFRPSSFIIGRAFTSVAWALVIGLLLSWLRKRRPGTISN